jgi:hypothetical protein
MAKSTAALFLAALVVFAAAVATPALAQNAAKEGEKKLDASECRAALEAAGGESALLARAPSCSAAATSTATSATPGSTVGDANAPVRETLGKCCSELKAAISSDKRIERCVCVPAVWEGAKNRIAEAGLRGVNANTVEAFARSCGLKFAGNGC